MNGELDLEDVYGKRLRAVKPDRQQVLDIRRAYKKNIVEDARRLISALSHLGHEIYIISGGLLEPVQEFGLYLGVPKDHVQAVGVSYNELSGKWWVEDQAQLIAYQKGALTVSDGKAEIIEGLRRGKRGRALLVGDGHSDLLASRAVDLFVGYGGVVSRPNVAQQAGVFVISKSLAPILPLATGPSGLASLTDSRFASLAKKSMMLVRQGNLTFNDDRLSAKFNGAFGLGKGAERGDDPLL